MIASIVGTSKITHAEEVVAATQIELSDEEIQLLCKPYKPHPVLGLT